MPSPEDGNQIDSLEQSLYSRNSPNIRTRRKMRISDEKSDVPTDWERPVEEKVDVVLNQTYKDHSMSFFTKLLIGSVVFCVLAIGAGAFIFFQGANLISADNIDISVSGPVSVPGGEPFSLDIRVVNKNNVDLRLADLAVEFPEGAADPNNPSAELQTYRQLLGDIPAGRSAEKTIQAIVFGEENLQKQIEISVTYSVKGSSALFTKTRTYDVLINSSPINVGVSSFKEVTSGQEFDFTVDVTSNSNQILRDLILTADYPFGFSFISSNIKPLPGNNSWKVGDIPAGAKRSITIRGVMQGEDQDIRVFRFIVGTKSASSPDEIGTEFMTVERELSIQKPFISLGVSVNNDDPASDYVARFGESSRVEVSWFNNLPVSVANVEIVAKISGSAYDKTTVQPELGHFRSADNQMIWNQQTVPELALVEAGESGVVAFTLTPKKQNSNQTTVDPVISIDVGVSGDRQESDVPQDLVSTANKLIKVASSVSLSGRLVRTTGPFTNTGPIPPKVEQKTSYTVIWTVTNTSSAVNNAKVTATIPPQVSWLGNISPSGENISYDKNSGTITWNIGNISPSTSGSLGRREVFFQVSFEPGIDLVEQSPIILNQAVLSASDDFTGTGLESTQDYMTTRFSTDPTYREGDEKVIP